jgi:hypothetical protein
MTDGLFSIRRFGHGIARAFEHDAQDFAQALFIVYN